VYLFEVGIPPLQTQKNQRELELLVQEGILNSIRESIPVEALLRAYMDESEEVEVKQEIKEIVKEKELTEEEKTQAAKEADKKSEVVSETKEPEPAKTGLESDLGGYSMMDLLSSPNASSASAPAAPASLTNEVEAFPELKVQTETSSSSSLYDNEDRIKISDEVVELGNLDVHVIDPTPAPIQEDLSLNLDSFIDDIEILA
jgi:hypothetical protein